MIGRVWREWVKPLALALGIVLPIKSALADWNWVPSGSMKPTILEGDLVLVNKLAYDLKVPFTTLHLAQWGDPQRGDIVVFFSPKDEVRLVKRVIGLPGDTLEMRDNVLFVNGKPLEYNLVSAEPYRREVFEDKQPVVARETGAHLDHLVMALPSRGALRNFPPRTVPADMYFMMGDSRDNSNDSRFFGFVARDRIVGQADGVVLSFDKNRWYNPRIQRFFSALK